MLLLYTKPRLSSIILLSKFLMLLHNFIIVCRNGGHAQSVEFTYARGYLRVATVMIMYNIALNLSVGLGNKVWR